MDLRLLCLFLVCLSLRGLVNGDEVRNVTARGYWKKIFEDVNSAAVPKEYTVQYFHGVKTEGDDESIVTAKGSGPIYYGWSEGDRLKILSIDIGIEGALKETKIHRQTEQTLKFTVQPGRKVVKWQFVIDIAGNEYDHDLIMTNANDDVPKDCDVKVTFVRRKLIHFGSTRIRIKHRKTDLYLTVVEREKWPAATTDRRRGFQFILYNYGNDGVVIRTLNSPVSGFEYLSVWTNVLKGGWIYGGPLFKYSDSKQMYWTISKTSLYEGIIVTFMSRHFRDSYLCRSSQLEDSPDNSVTNVFACHLEEDEWILELP